MEKVKRRVIVNTVDIVLKKDGKVEIERVKIYGKLNAKKVKSESYDGIYLGHDLVSTEEVMYECPVDAFVKASVANMPETKGEDDYE